MIEGSPRPALAARSRHDGWQPRQLRISYPTSEQPWEPLASPAHLITGAELFAHAQRHFDARGDHYLLVRATDGFSRPVLDIETMDVMPLIDGVVEMRLVKLL